MCLLKIFTALLALCAPIFAQLDTWAKAAGLKYFGTAVDNPSLGNAAYMKILRDTGANSARSRRPTGKNGANTESGQGQFSYGGGDAIANIAKQTRQLLRCHTLVWYNQLPGWGTSDFHHHQHCQLWGPSGR